jgi:hypothetical protein
VLKNDIGFASIAAVADVFSYFFARRFDFDDHADL